MWRRGSAFDGMIFGTHSGRKYRSCASAAEWNVRATTPRAPRSARRALSSPAALSVKVTARISRAANVPVVTWFAIRRVIVVVLPVPAPARMQTGPRTACAARRCSSFRPARASTEPPYRRARRAPGTSVQRVFQNRFGADPLRILDHRAELRDDAERVALLDEVLELGEPILEPVVVDRSAGRPHDLRMRGGADHLAVVPEHLVQLLAGTGTREHDRDLALVLARQVDHLLGEVED